MSLRDDMVIRPRAVLGEHNSVRERAKAKRRDHAHRKGKRGLFQRLVRAKTAKKAIRRSGLLKAPGVKRVAGAGRAAGRAGARLLANPAALIIAGLAAVAVVGGRIASGRPFEGVGQDVNDLLLGSMDDEARAGLRARNDLLSDPHILRLVAEKGEVGQGVRDIFNGLKKVYTQQQIGISMLRSEFPVNTTLDLLIVRGKDAFMRAWNAGGGPEAVRECREHLSVRAHGAPAGWGGVR